MRAFYSTGVHGYNVSSASHDGSGSCIAGAGKEVEVHIRMTEKRASDRASCNYLAIFASTFDI